MGTELRNILAYTVELIKIMIVTVGIMGFKLKVKWHGFLVFLLSGIIVVITSDVKFIPLIIALLTISTAIFILTEKRRFICSLLAYLSISMLDIMTAAVILLVTGLEAAALYNSAPYHFTVNSFSIVILLIITVVRLRSDKPSLYHIKHMRIVYIITSIISQVCFLLYLTPALVFGFDKYSKPFVAVGVSFSGLFFIVSNVLLVESLFSKKLFKSLYNNSRKQSENLLNYVDTRLETAKKRQKIEHDMPYHLLSLQSLVKNGDIEELEKYIDSLTGRFAKCGQAVSTGNHQLNAIIAGCIEKYQNTEVDIKGIMPNELNIPLHDFCVILSNLLDNAFKFSAGIVKIEINTHKENLYIRIVNPVKRKVEITDNVIKSANIGTLNVSEYVGKNNGKIFYRCSDKYFTVDLYLNI